MCCCSAVQITSSAQNLEKYEGDTVQLVCEFAGDDFNLFDNPVVWHKMQLIHHHGSDGDEVYNESSQINMMSTVLEPFSATKRFKPTFHSTPPTFRFALLITGNVRTLHYPSSSSQIYSVVTNTSVIHSQTITVNETGVKCANRWVNATIN